MRTSSILRRWRARLCIRRRPPAIDTFPVLCVSITSAEVPMDEPIPSVLAGLPTFAWDDRESVAYEVALEAIGQVVAWYTALITAEQDKAEPDAARIAQWDTEQTAAIVERNALRSTDHQAVARVQREYRRKSDELAAAAGQ